MLNLEGSARRMPRMALREDGQIIVFLEKSLREHRLFHSWGLKFCGSFLRHFVA